MFRFDLTQIAVKVGGKLIGADVDAFDLVIENIAIDSRIVEQGDLFVAIKGENHDGADYIPQAVACGAAAVIAEAKSDISVPQIVVDDSWKALAALGNMARESSEASFVAVTGSNGKTTVKEMIKVILSEVAPTLATQGNLNNEIGVPLTLFALGQEHKYAVIEMGASKNGDIKYLTQIARPDISVVTNASAAHLQGFGGLEGVAKTKGEIFESLPEEGTAIINADDEFAGYWKDVSGSENIITFGKCQTADVRLGKIDDSGAEIETPNGELLLNLKLPGMHNINNAMTATAVAIALNIPLPTIKSALEKMGSVKGRLCFQKANAGGTVIDDSYNANPASLQAGLQVLSEQDGEKWLLLGDMAELGDDTELFHAQAAQTAHELGVTRLFACGANSEILVENFGVGAQAYQDVNFLINDLNKDLIKGITLLVKGSRMMKLDQVVNGISVKSNNGGKR
ncbi:MAG: UDP-N-acetylmuramoyl-tripeptide--D-alanyl-D-alanine ligase [Gammaproteobacteria bacterium]|nr:MAG: UDP-N-acetylmuramoyl-tripeptide--D-alanyl-D-alanine ligase [Gammaproteobacteria bacterium]